MMSRFVAMVIPAFTMGTTNIAASVQCKMLSRSFVVFSTATTNSSLNSMA